MKTLFLFLFLPTQIFSQSSDLILLLSGEASEPFYSFVAAETDTIIVAHSATIEFGTNDFSTSLWIRGTWSETGGLVAKYKATENYLIRADADGKLRTITRESATNASTQTVNSYNDGEWHSVVCTYDRDGDQNIYVDNVLDIAGVISTRSGDINNGEPLTIGTYAGSLHFTGDIKKVRLYGKVLDAAERTAIFNDGTIPTTVMNLDGTNMTNETWFDQSGNSNDGTVNGATLK